MNILRWAGHRSTNLFVRTRRGNTRPAIVNDRRQKAAENPDDRPTSKHPIRIILRDYSLMNERVDLKRKKLQLLWRVSVCLTLF